MSHTCGQRCYQTRGNSKLALSYIAAKRAEVVWSIGVWRQLVYTQRGAQRRFALRRGIRRHLAKVNAGVDGSVRAGCLMSALPCCKGNDKTAGNVDGAIGQTSGGGWGVQGLRNAE